MGKTKEYVVSQPYEKIIPLLKDLISLRNPGAMHLLGSHYLKGNCVDIDFDKAFYLLNKSYEMGYFESYMDLFNCYWYGFGVEKNLDKAMFWASKLISEEANEEKKERSKKIH